MNESDKHELPINDCGYRRRLKNRHVQLIALGGVIGSGYFLGTGEIIQQVGPSVFFAYAFGGLIVYLTMICMGELAVAIPISGSFITYTAAFISPTVACGVGWSYWVSWIAYIPAECIAGGIILEYFTGVNGYLWAICFGLLITYINIANVEIFGEIEFWLASIKIIALMIFVVLSGLIFFGIIHGSQPEGIIGTKFIYGEGGFFPNGGMALLTAMVLLLVNYQGTEIIGLAAGESIDPEIMIPSAIRNVTLRILFIYIIPVFCLVLIYPWSKANIATPVFSDVLSYYGLKKVGAVISFVTVTAALSCANSGVYGIARSLNALARGCMAPKKLALLNEHAVPQNAVIVTLLSIWLLLAIGGFFGQSKLYIALLLVSGFTGLMAWISICLSQINFRNLLYKAGYTVNDLKYKTPGSPYTGIFAIILMCGCLLFLLFHESLLYIMAFVIGCISFIVPIGIYKFNNLINARSVKYDKKTARKTFYEIFPKCKPK